MMNSTAQVNTAVIKALNRKRRKPATSVANGKRARNTLIAFTLSVISPDGKKKSSPRLLSCFRDEQKCLGLGLLHFPAQPRAHPLRWSKLVAQPRIQCLAVELDAKRKVGDPNPERLKERQVV